MGDFRRQKYFTTILKVSAPTFYLPKTFAEILIFFCLENAIFAPV